MLGNISVMGAIKCIRRFVNEQKLAKRRLPGSMLPSGCERITWLCVRSVSALKAQWLTVRCLQIRRSLSAVLRVINLWQRMKTSNGLPMQRTHLQPMLDLFYFSCCFLAKSTACEISRDMDAKDFISSVSGSAQSHFSRNMFSTSESIEFRSLGSRLHTSVSAFFV